MSRKEDNSIYLGKKVRIMNMYGEPDYVGREGTVQYVDDAGQLIGTWGGCAIIPEKDCFQVISE